MTSLRTLVTTLVAIACTRVEILITEYEHEKIRLGRILAIGIAMIFFVAMALIFLSLLVLVLFWNDHRLAALGGITIIYMLLAVAAAWRLRCSMKQKSRLFATSLGELRKDHLELES
ncbi:MAG: phage holin family protein [Gammaproteobacteria bacterium]